MLVRDAEAREVSDLEEEEMDLPTVAIAWFFVETVHNRSCQTSDIRGPRSISCMDTLQGPQAHPIQNNLLVGPFVSASFVVLTSSCESAGRARLCLQSILMQE